MTRPARQSVAIVGAGISGLRCARRLAEAGVAATVFDKGRGVAGRMATRRADGGLRFDHGAQYFTARGPAFAAAVRQWLAAGLVAEYRGRLVATAPDETPASKPGEDARYVGVPGMNAVCKAMAEGLDVRTGTRIAILTRGRGRWSLTSDRGLDLGRFDAVVLALPAPQVVELLPQGDPIAEQAGAAAMAPTLTVMAAFDQPIGAEFDAAFINDSPLAFVMREQSKPGRGGGPAAGEAWVLHAGHEWSTARLELEPRTHVGPALAAFSEVVGGGELPSPVFATAHRWRYAAVAKPVGAACLFDGARGIAAAGDWCLGNRVECAFDSGGAAAEAVLTVV